MTITTHSLGETKEVAWKFVRFLNKLKLADNPAGVFGFSGDLGSGKTTFTKAMAEILGIAEHVTSPTFVIEKKYAINPTMPELSSFPFKYLIHIDAYRLENARELEVLNFLEDATNPENLILIEWPEKVIEILPKNTQIIRFSFVDEHVRTIEFPDMMAV